MFYFFKKKNKDSNAKLVNEFNQAVLEVSSISQLENMLEESICNNDFEAVLEINNAIEKRKQS